MKSFAEIDIEKNGNYLKLLSAVSKLSGLFSESAIPFINYRVAENIFCRSFDAGNLSRSDTAFDANYNSMGVGLKTFVCNSNNSTEKVAEFNSLSRVLADFQGKDLAHKLAEFRNERIDLANRLYNIESSLYHIVARKTMNLCFLKLIMIKLTSKTFTLLNKTMQVYNLRMVRIFIVSITPKAHFLENSTFPKMHSDFQLKFWKTHTIYYLSFLKIKI